MANRALRVGDRVVIRPGCVAKLSHQQAPGITAHDECEIVDESGRQRRCLFLRPPLSWGTRLVLAWPSEVRLASGAAERADLRFEKREKEIAAMKAARRKSNRKGHNHNAK